MTVRHVRSEIRRLFRACFQIGESASTSRFSEAFTRFRSPKTMLMIRWNVPGEFLITCSRHFCTAKLQAETVSLCSFFMQGVILLAKSLP